MTEINPDFLAHLEQRCTMLCHCWRVVRRDGQSFGFTDHDRPLVVDGVAYNPQSGFSQSEARASLGMAIDTVDVEGALSSEVLDEAELEAGLFDGAVVETRLVNWNAPSEFALIRRSSIGRITRSDSRFIAELESMAASLDQPNGRYLRRLCDARLGDARCGVSLAGSEFNGSGVVTSQTAPATVSVSGLDGFTVGWFSFGHVTWASGVLVGRTATLLDHKRTPEGVLLVLPPTEQVPPPGTAFSVVAGCDKRFSTCKTKFGNPLNFRGFPHLPGNDAAYGYVTDGGIFDGGPIVE
ncbi:DUF2163 domain-containing protein [Mesorhizobium sp. CAU 1741]|uniref:DUF2163 domain-containing protein n=1 Tax=Mesorhizobium sp. CAU 1741 TaxID=3140366 RepID=UPI00325B83C1